MEGDVTRLVALQVHVRVQIPKRVSGEEKKLVEELREVSSGKAKGRWGL